MIADIGPDDEVGLRHPNVKVKYKVDASGKSIIPGKPLCQLSACFKLTYRLREHRI